jgi:hypothetical protein
MGNNANRMGLLISLGSDQSQGNKVVGIGTLHFNGIPLPPGQVPSELKGHQIGEDVVVEETAQSAGVVTTDFKGFAPLMGSVAFPLHTGDGGFHPAAYSWILGHLLSPYQSKFLNVQYHFGKRKTFSLHL